mmetsp:Transcript_61065/g.171117  ORF Transcript_61065/g.171117 Transcript_61065/m.171117 type:complete len:221 (-) Transcript_61065:412-1074(-)
MAADCRFSRMCAPGLGVIDLGRTHEGASIGAATGLIAVRARGLHTRGPYTHTFTHPRARRYENCAARRAYAARDAIHCARGTPWRSYGEAANNFDRRASSNMLSLPNPGGAEFATCAKASRRDSSDNWRLKGSCNDWGSCASWGVGFSSVWDAGSAATAKPPPNRLGAKCTFRGSPCTGALWASGGRGLATRNCPEPCAKRHWSWLRHMPRWWNLQSVRL